MRMRRWLAALVLIVLVLSVDAEQWKNTQILTGMSRQEVWDVMNQMRASLGVDCHFCHVKGDVPSDAKPQKVRGREMMRMVMDLNARYFSGKPVVTCFTCHDGKVQPARMPPLPQAMPPETKPVEAKALPALASVIQKYVAAVGRELAPSAARRFRGTLKSSSGASAQGTVLTAGDKQRTDITLPDGSTLSRAFDSKGGWARDKDGVHDLTSQQLDAVLMARRPFAPFHTSSIGEDARVTDSEKIGDRSAWVVTTPKARYWFDAESGFLLRRVVYFDSPIGRIPEQTDFDDYRDAGGSKVPFFTRGSLVDPYLSGARQAESIEVGIAILAGEFEKP